ncbi:hypothetical protein SUDANB171_00217 [Streptomyces sp. enrichment culture]
MGEYTMRAVTIREFGGPEVLTVERAARPEPLPTEVLVRVHAAGINPVDWKTREGQGVAGLQTLPLILGWDVSGVVEQVGFGVTTLKAGDEVYGMPWFPRTAGGYAEYVTAPARQWARKPATLDHVHAAAVPLAALFDRVGEFGAAGAQLDSVCDQVQRSASRGSARSARAKTLPAWPAPFLKRPMEGWGYFMWVANQSSISLGSRWKCR